MSAYDPTTDSPPAIATLEQALVHLILLAENLYGAQTYQERQNQLAEDRVNVGIVSTADGEKTMIARIAIPMDPVYVTDTSQKLWMYVKELGQVTVPAAWKVD